MRSPFSAVGIVGVGQIGGSMALALRQQHPELALIGVDLNVGRLHRAEEFLTRTSTDLTSLQEAELVVLAVPVRAVLALMGTLFARFPTKLFVDTASTKVQVMAEAEKLGRAFRFVGGHPLAGSEKAGESGWNADLFEGRLFFLCEKSGGREAREAAEWLVSSLKARAVWLEPALHDAHLAYTSHFAYLLSALYLNQGKAGKKLDSRFLGSGFRSMARLAGSSPEMGLDMLLTNREEVLAEVRRFQHSLEEIKALLEEEQTNALQNFLKEISEIWKKVGGGD